MGFSWLSSWFAASSGAGSGSIDAWPVFKPGFWKGRYYTAQDCKDIVNNFQLLSTGERPYLRVKAKLGHDPGQKLAQALGFAAGTGGLTDPPGRAKQSIGLPSCGNVTDCQLGPNNEVQIWVRNIPPGLMTEIKEKRIADGSVEIKRGLPNPKDPTQVLRGPVLEYIAFLGEETPGVRGLPIPSVQFSEDYQTIITNRHPTTTVECLKFSEFETVDKDAILAELAKYIDVTDAIRAMDPDQLTAVLDSVQSQNTMQKMGAYCTPQKATMSDPASNAPAVTPVPATNPTDSTKPAVAPMANQTTDQMGEMKRMFSSMLSEATTPINDRLNGMEASSKAAMSAATGVQAKMGQAIKFSQEYAEHVHAQHKVAVTTVVKNAVSAGRLQPFDLDDFVAIGMGKSTSAKFSDGSPETQYEAWVKAMADRPVTAMFGEEVSVQAGDDGTNDPFIEQCLKASHQGRVVLAEREKAKK